MYESTCPGIMRTVYFFLLGYDLSSMGHEARCKAIHHATSTERDGVCESLPVWCIWKTKINQRARNKSREPEEISNRGVGDGRKRMINKGKDQCWIKIRRRLQWLPRQQALLLTGPRQGRAIAWVIRGSTVLMYKLKKPLIGEIKEGWYLVDKCNELLPLSVTSSVYCSLKSFHMWHCYRLKYRFRLPLCARTYICFPPLYVHTDK